MLLYKQLPSLLSFTADKPFWCSCCSTVAFLVTPISRLSSVDLLAARNNDKKGHLTPDLRVFWLGRRRQKMLYCLAAVRLERLELAIKMSSSNNHWCRCRGSCIRRIYGLDRFVQLFAPSEGRLHVVKLLMLRSERVVVVFFEILGNLEHNVPVCCTAEHYLQRVRPSISFFFA